MTDRLRCLWVTRLIPYPPHFGGDVIYSARLIDALAAAGASVTVLTHQNGTTPGGDPAVSWVAVPFEDRRAWRSLIQPVPSIVDRFSTPTLIARLRELLDAELWDAVVVDNIAMARAADAVVRDGKRRARRPRLVYLSHNHETSVRAQAARRFQGSPAVRLAAQFDAWKVGRVESRLVRSVDVVTANTPDDEVLFRRGFPGMSSLVLMPGYDGPVDVDRPISAQTPRRAIVLGSFGWVGKQVNLLTFLEAASPRFSAASAEIAVVGAMSDEFEATLRRRYPLVAIHRSVQDVRPFLAAARLGVVPEEIGGGFKHKVLNYVFNGLPVAALKGSVNGVPLTPGLSILEFPTLELLAEGAVSAIDDLGRLNTLRITAAAACAGLFDWQDRGVALLRELDVATGSIRRAGTRNSPSRHSP